MRPLPSLEVVRLGLISYSKGLQLQQQYIDIVKSSRDSGSSRNFCLLLEHDPVYTVGIRSKLYSVEEEQRLCGIGAQFFRTNRGGLITFHGPGQLVAYPIMDLRSLSVPAPLSSSSGRPSNLVGARRYVFLLEETLIGTVESFGIAASRSEHTGVWVGNGSRKIASIGLSIQHGVTSHGVALNCNTDLGWFSHITACGIEGVETTSLSHELQHNISVDEAADILVKRLCSNLHVNEAVKNTEVSSS